MASAILRSTWIAHSRSAASRVFLGRYNSGRGLAPHAYSFDRGCGSPESRARAAGRCIRLRHPSTCQAFKVNVFYEEEGTLKVGAVLADNVTSLQVEAPHGKRSKIKSANVLLRFE